eukprot:145126-Chlamydomonas_euryale.AAC.1
MDCEDLELTIEGCTGMWELSINRENHSDIRYERVKALLARLSSPSLAVVSVAAAAVWGLATSAMCRRAMAELNVVADIVAAIRRALKEAPNAVADAAMAGPRDATAGSAPRAMSVSQLLLLQRHLIG